MTQPFDVQVFPGRAAAGRWRGLWRLADPKIALASLVPLAAGGAFAAAGHASFRAAPFVGAVVAIFAIEVGKNAVNDLYDFRSGADLGVRPDERSPFSGGKRVLVEALLTEKELVLIAAVAFLAAAMMGVVTAAIFRPSLLWLGIAGAIVSVEYTAPPLRLCYRGLGEAAVFGAYGPGILLGSEYLVSGRVSTGAVECSVSLGALIACVLLVNELPDERADRAAGKRTLVLRLGRRHSVRLISALFVFAFLLPIVAVVYLAAPPRSLGLLAGIPAAWLSIADLRRVGSPAAPIRAQALTLISYVSAGAGVIAALLA